MPALRVPGETLNGALLPAAAPRPRNRARSWSIGPDAGSWTRRRTTATWAARCCASTQDRSAIPPRRAGSCSTRRTAAARRSDRSARMIPDPAWMRTADSVTALGDALGLPSGSLGHTVAEFNADAGTRCRHRGSGAATTSTTVGSATRAEHPTLAALAVAALLHGRGQARLPRHQGGPRTDASGRVRRNGGGFVDGCTRPGTRRPARSASRTAGGGSTIGPALVFGTRRRSGGAPPTDGTGR